MSLPSVGPGGMPRSKYQHAFDDFLIPEEAAAEPSSNFNNNQHPPPPPMAHIPTADNAQEFYYQQQQQQQQYPRTQTMMSSASSMRSMRSMPQQGPPSSFNPYGPDPYQIMANDSGPYMSPAMPRTAATSSSSVGRRASNASKASSLFNWRGKKNVHDEFNGDEDMFDDFSSATGLGAAAGGPSTPGPNGARYPSGASTSSLALNNMLMQQQQRFSPQGNLDMVEGATDLGMNQLKSLRDRDRYPTITSNSSALSGMSSPDGSRTMSMRSMTNSTFDTTPIIPILSPVGATKKNKEYRKNLTLAQRKMLHASDGGAPGGFLYGQQQQNQMDPQNLRMMMMNGSFPGTGGGGPFPNPNGHYQQTPPQFQPNGAFTPGFSTATGPNRFPGHPQQGPQLLPANNPAAGPMANPMRRGPSAGVPGQGYYQGPGSANGGAPAMGPRSMSMTNNIPSRGPFSPPPPQQQHQGNNNTNFSNNIHPAPSPGPYRGYSGPIGSPNSTTTTSPGYQRSPQNATQIQSQPLHLHSPAPIRPGGPTSPVSESVATGYSPKTPRNAETTGYASDSPQNVPDASNAASTTESTASQAAFNEQATTPLQNVPSHPTYASARKLQPQQETTMSQTGHTLNPSLATVSSLNSDNYSTTSQHQQRSPGRRPSRDHTNADDEKFSFQAPVSSSKIQKALIPETASTTTQNPQELGQQVHTHVAIPASVPIVASEAVSEPKSMSGLGRDSSATSTPLSMPPTLDIPPPASPLEIPANLSFSATPPLSDTSSRSMSRPSSSTFSSFDPIHVPLSKPATGNTDSDLSFNSGPSSTSISSNTTTPTMTKCSINKTDIDTTEDTTDSSVQIVSTQPSVLSPETHHLPLSMSSPKSTSDRGISVGDDSLVSQATVESTKVLELTLENQVLLNEVRLIAFELADSVKRELGIESFEDQSDTAAIDAATEDTGVKDISDSLVGELSMDSTARARMVVQLQRKLDMERRKRVALESRLANLEKSVTNNGQGQITEIYDHLALQNDLIKKDHELLDMKLNFEDAQKSVAELRAKCGVLERERDDAQAATQKIKEENKTLQKELASLLPSILPSALLTKNNNPSASASSPSAVLSAMSRDEKVRAIESQRDALRDALRSHRELKDHEIRQLQDRVKQLESKWEKERMVNLQLQQKIVLGNSSSSVNKTGVRSSSSSGGSVGTSATTMTHSNSNGSISAVLAQSPGSNMLPTNLSLPSPSSEGYFNLTPPKRRVASKGSFYNLSFGGSSSNLLDSVTAAGSGAGGSYSSSHTGGIIRSSSPAPLTLTTGMGAHTLAATGSSGQGSRA